MENVSANIFTKFDKDWGLVTAGTKDKFNSMTVSWGAMGTLWRKPVVQIYIRPTRYTFKFLEENEYFTVSFYDKKYKKALGIMGSKSGRDCDKVKEAGLTPKFLENGVTFEEASQTFVLKKIYFDQFKRDKVPQFAIEKFYEPADKEPPHFIVIGQVVQC